MATNLRVFLSLALVFTASAGSNETRSDDSTEPFRVFLVGDSTVKNGSDRGDGELWGWGHFLQEHLDPSRARVENRAIGGRSSRTFITEGRWEKVVAELKPGDYVLIQFGHNDGGPIDTGRARASLKGTGEESKEVILEATKKSETVRTYGWYLRKYVADTRPEARSR